VSIETQGVWLNAVTYKRTFGSFADFLALAENDGGGGSSRDVSEEKARYDWARGADFAQAMSLARAGWAEGREIMNRFRARFDDRLKQSVTERQTTRRDVTGAYVDIGAFLSGEPECMLDFDTEEVQGHDGKILRVSVDYGANYRVTAEQYLTRGAAMLAVVDALENYGYRCEIVALKATETNGSTYLVEFPIKASGEHIEIDRLAFIVGHPAMHRRLGFSTMENEPKDVRSRFRFYFGGYGSSITSPEYADIKCPALMDEGATAQWVLSTLAQYGVTEEPAQ
jgi:hypothetical protein